MKVSRIEIQNFRGIRSAVLLLPTHSVLIGDNNTGKTTILEALDLALGPDRLGRQAPIDEHDFFEGKYRAEPQRPSTSEDPLDDVIEEVPGPLISIEVVVSELSEEQSRMFSDQLEFWDSQLGELSDLPPAARNKSPHISEAIRVTFRGWYEKDEDDFEGKTYFSRSLLSDDEPVHFTRKHKQNCGFLYLRSVRTGTRALSLEHGSLLDIILRIKEVRPQMWEGTLNELSEVAVAAAPEFGISPILDSINEALKKYVPREWGVQPRLKVSSLTREHLRKVITAFVATGEGKHAAPFYRQGTGTINMLVLAMLSQIAEGRNNVIFAMEEPETAIPPYAQKRIVHEVKQLASQSIFTSHSPYVLEEFNMDETVVLSRDSGGTLTRNAIGLPEGVKEKRYRQEFRTRFCEGLLSRRVLVAEGATEAAAFPVVCRRLAELNPKVYKSLESLGICTVDAGGENSIPDIATLYGKLGKQVFGICDLQEEQKKTLIEAHVDLLLMHPHKGFEELVIEGTTTEALKRFAEKIDWPQHLLGKYPNPVLNAKASLADYFLWSKGSWGVADFLASCSETEIPMWLREALLNLVQECGGANAAVQSASLE